MNQFRLGCLLFAILIVALICGSVYLHTHYEVRIDKFDNVLAYDSYEEGENGHILHKYSSRCLTRAAGDKIILQSCNNVDDQKWRYHNDHNLIYNHGNAQCMSIDGMANNSVIFKDCALSDPDQKWDYNKNNNSQIISQKVGKVIHNNSDLLGTSDLSLIESKTPKKYSEQFMFVDSAQASRILSRLR